MTRYEFNVVIVGDGKDKESAWIDAVEAFALDCGSPPTTESKDGGNAECFWIDEDEQLANHNPSKNNK